MAIRYADWLKATGKAGTEADALIWKKTHGVALGLYTPTGERVGSAPAAPSAPSIPDVQQNPSTAPIISAYEDRLKNMAAKYDPLRASATKQYEAAILPYSSGQAERDTARSVKEAAAPRGMLYSSFTDRNMGAALGRLKDQAAAVTDQYSKQLLTIANKESDEKLDIGGKLTELFGQNASWAIENPPVAPSAPSAPAPTKSSADKRPDGLYTALGFANWLKGAGRPVPSGSQFRDLYWGYLAKHGAQPQ